MTQWWEQGYPGGPMVAVKGFPRPCYPPDAQRHPATIDGSDVEAYKRTISRAGRWRWQAFDQAFSNAFSHGKPPGNVAESGVAGVQRQAKIQPTGFVGEKTFNLLRSIRIPQGLPHAGEPAMDARSVELINAAWERFRGSPTPNDRKGKPTGQARLERAQSQLGYAEGANNANKFGAWYGADNQPWCAMFVTWADLTGQSPSPATFKCSSRYAYVPYILADARLGYYGLAVTSQPEPGDLVLYDFTFDGEYDHVGVFEAGSSSSWKAIEGNTSPEGSSGSQSNGGGVYRRNRTRSQADVVFVRVAA